MFQKKIIIYKNEKRNTYECEVDTKCDYPFINLEPFTLTLAMDSNRNTFNTKSLAELEAKKTVDTIELLYIEEIITWILNEEHDGGEKNV